MTSPSEKRMDTLRGYKLKGRKGLIRWDALLEEWLLAIERYGRIMIGEDAAYWYNERSNISVLSGAAWRCGRIALEEFQQKKGYRNRQKRNGRCDLWISTETEEDLIEAKFKWISLRSKRNSTFVDAIMDNAISDAKRTRANDVDANAIAVGFFPVYTPNQFIKDIDKLIESSLSEFHGIDYHALAWSFPKENRTTISSTGYLCPGIFMVVKNVDYC